MTVSRRTAIASGAAALTMAGAAAAQKYPRQAIQIIVAFPPGGSTDVGARIVASIAEKEFGQPVVVVNQAGAGGQAGFTELARARPDGYTIGFINLPGMNTIILDPERKATYDIDSFVPVINQVLDPGIIWVKANSPHRSLANLIEAARKAPGQISTCTSGKLSDDHLAILMLQEAAKAEFRIVHFDGGAQQLSATLGGQVDVAFDNVGSVVKRVQSGEVRVLAVMDNTRSRFLPNAPTTRELGYATVISSSTRGIAAPKGTPVDVVRTLEAGFRKAMDSPEHLKKLDDAGLALHIMSGEVYTKYYRDMHAQAKKYTEWALKMR